MQGLTDPQSRVFELVRDTIERTGRAPTIEEIGAHIHRSKPTAFDHVRVLIKLGYLVTPKPPRSARNLALGPKAPASDLLTAAEAVIKSTTTQSVGAVCYVSQAALTELMHAVEVSNRSAAAAVMEGAPA